MARNKLIALDADGVLLDYHAAYAQAWANAFGEAPELIDPLGYTTMDRYKVRHLSGSELAHFRLQMNDDFWASLSPMAGALDATIGLSNAGYDLVCLTAIHPKNKEARLRNLKKIGFPIETVIAAHGESSVRSPKADALEQYKPAAFVDDYLPYLRGAPHSVHTALIMRSPNGSPNKGPELVLANSQHTDLLDFANFWIGRP